MKKDVLKQVLLSGDLGIRDPQLLLDFPRVLGAGVVPMVRHL